MAGKLEIIQGVTAHHYHVLPSELSRATVSPEREAIFQYLSRLGSERFVDFITDILVQVENHRLIERTDGPGDEKQDILTLDPEGQQQLTQCKHTINYDDNTSGDELDLLFSACFRKNCRRALYVTNADLTVQAKRYVTDKEYTRGWKGSKELLPSIDYWNGRRIWERISRSNVILNKWFSGMAQVHALRRFFTDVIVTRMPSGDVCPLKTTEVAKELSKTHRVVERPEDHSFDVSVDENLMLNLRDWFRGSLDLGVAFLPPSERYQYPNVPLSTIRVQAFLSETVGAFDVALYRDRIGSLVGAVLPNPDEGVWWHLLVTAPQAFVFLHDIGKAVLVSVEQPEAFVRVGERAPGRERTWAVRPGQGFERSGDPDDPDDEVWRNNATGMTMRVLVDQDIHPLTAYELQLSQAGIIKELRGYAFRALENADASVVETVRRLSDPKWYVLQSSSGDLFWTYPPDAERGSVEKLERVLQRRGLQILSVGDEDRELILTMIDTTPVGRRGLIVTGEHALTPPVLLNQRTFWFSREYALEAKVSEDQVLEILKFKASYEAEHGHDLLAGRPEGIFASEEFLRLLFDPMTFRGRRMIDVGFHGGKVFVNLRVRDGSILSADDLAQLYAPEFDRIYIEILNRLSVTSSQFEPGHYGTEQP